MNKFSTSFIKIMDPKKGKQTNDVTKLQTNFLNSCQKNFTSEFNFDFSKIIKIVEIAINQLLDFWLILHPGSIKVVFGYLILRT